MFLYLKNKASGDIFEENGVSDQFRSNKESKMVQLNRIQLTSQTPNHAEMTTILSTSQGESKIIDC